MHYLSWLSRSQISPPLQLSLYFSCKNTNRNEDVVGLPKTKIVTFNHLGKAKIPSTATLSSKVKISQQWCHKIDHIDHKPCGWQALGAPARHQGCASEVGEPSSGHWSTRDLPAPHNIKRQKSPRDLHLNANTQLHSMTSKLQCWTPYAKKLATQEHNLIH